MHLSHQQSSLNNDLKYEYRALCVLLKYSTQNYIIPRKGAKISLLLNFNYIAVIKKE